MAQHNDLILRMDFANTPYTSETIARPVTSARKESKRSKQRGFSRTMTAKKVADILEGKYGILETFYEIHEDEIKNIMHEGFKEVAERIITEREGRTTAKIKNLMKPSTNQIEELFRSFLDQEEMNGMVEGVPTKAAMSGVRHGRGSKTKHGARPSFIDTGIYRASFRAMVK
jgi:vacuolar-type H+-ATPase subunit E/Vma4